MTSFIAPAAAVSIVQQRHAEEINRAEQHRLAREFSRQQRLSQPTDRPKRSSWFGAVFGHRQAAH